MSRLLWKQSLIHFVTCIFVRLVWKLFAGFASCLRALFVRITSELRALFVILSVARYFDSIALGIGCEPYAFDSISPNC